MKYLLTLLIPIYSFAGSPFNQEIDYANIDWAHKKKSYELAEMEPYPWATHIHVQDSLDRMQVLIEFGRSDPKSLQAVVKEIQKELDECRLWLALQHSN